MRVLLFLGVTMVLLVGCAEQPVEPQTASTPSPTHTTNTPDVAPETQPADDKPVQPEAATEPTAGAERAVMALVNGKPVYMDKLHDLLLRDYGMDVAQQLIANELVRQEAEKHGISVTKEDINRQQADMLQRAFGELDNEAQRQQLLAQMLNRYGISENIWQMIMRRQAMLDKLANREVELSEEELKRAFGEQYGRKVVVRHIQTPSLEDAQELLDKLQEGADFAELAESESTNPSAADGGLLPPIGRDTENVPPAIRSAAMAMEEVGELSEPVQSGTTFHVLKLDRVIPPQDVELPDVRDELEADLREREIAQAGQQIFHRLMTEAQQQDAIEFVNPVLKQQLEQAREEAERQLP